MQGWSSKSSCEQEDMNGLNDGSMANILTVVGSSSLPAKPQAIELYCSRKVVPSSISNFFVEVPLHPQHSTEMMLKKVTTGLCSRQVLQLEHDCPQAAGLKRHFGWRVGPSPPSTCFFSRESAVNGNQGKPKAQWDPLGLSL